MQALELKIPPPAIAALVAGAMWAVAQIAPLIDVPDRFRVTAALALALAGGVFDSAAIVSFYRARTTVNPFKPQATSTFVRTGIYRLTRNPMYVGLLLFLLAWALYLACAWVLLGPLAFVAYITRFQIVPEERALGALFGDEYATYKATVRRWL